MKTLTSKTPVAGIRVSDLRELCENRKTKLALLKLRSVEKLSPNQTVYLPEDQLKELGVKVIQVAIREDGTEKEVTNEIEAEVERETGASIEYQVVLPSPQKKAAEAK